MQKLDFKAAVYFLSVMLATAFVSSSGMGLELRAEPDSLNFGRVSIGDPNNAQSILPLTISNDGGAEATLSAGIVLHDGAGRYELLSPAGAEARNAILKILDGVGSYRCDYEEDPASLELLREMGYVELSQLELEEWTFSFIGLNPINQIEAVSTEEMPDGAGREVLFDLQTFRFFGYGPISEFSLSGHSSRSFYVVCSPEEESPLTGTLELRSPEGAGLDVELQAAGVHPVYLTFSTDVINFHEVEVNRRGKRLLRIRNGGVPLINTAFDLSDPDHFAINDEFTDAVQEILLQIETASIMYHQDNGEDPSSVEELIEEGYLVIDENHLRQWTFSLIGSPIVQIEAVSTAEMPGGAGHVVLYDLATRSFNGYGHREGALLGRGLERSFCITFTPNELGEYDELLHITAFNERILSYSQSYDIMFFGEGALIVQQAPEPYPFQLRLSSAFPNPFNSTATVLYRAPASGLLRATLRDEAGRLVREWTVASAASGSGEIMVDLQGLSAGNYWLGLDQNGLNAVTRLTLVR